MATAKKKGAAKVAPVEEKRIGRPPIPESDRKARMIRVLVSVEQEAVLKEAARREGRSLSEWLRYLGLKAAGAE